MSSGVSEVVASTPGGREFCSCAVLNHSSTDSNDQYIGLTPVAESGFTGTVEGLDVFFDCPVTTGSYGVKFYLRVVNQSNPALIFQTLEYFRMRLANAERPVVWKLKNPLNFVCPPGYFLVAHYHSMGDSVSFLSTANVKWKSYNVE